MEAVSLKSRLGGIKITDEGESASPPSHLYWGPCSWGDSLPRGLPRQDSLGQRWYTSTPHDQDPPSPFLGSAVLPVVQLQSLFDSGGQALTNAVSKQGIFAQDDSDTQIFLCCLPEL